MLAFGLSVPSAAQDVGNCLAGKAWSDLDANHVHASLYNGGSLFWPGSGARYRVPKQSDVNAVFLATIQMGGLVGGEYRMAGSNYGPMDFWPGPLDESGRPPQNCVEYDRIFSIDRDSLAEFERVGNASRDLAGMARSSGRAGHRRRRQSGQL